MIELYASWYSGARGPHDGATVLQLCRIATDRPCAQNVRALLTRTRSGALSLNPVTEINVYESPSRQSNTIYKQRFKVHRS